MDDSMVLIDGSEGEGGGQILRTALALSCLTGRPFRIVNIRANRPRPGLRAQHLVCVKAAAELAQAEVEGARVGSDSVEFRPRAIRGGVFSFDVGTAGSLSLVLQTVLLPALRAPEPVVLHLTGGTHVPFSPPYDYLERQFGYWLARMGVRPSFALERAGYYPGGGGAIAARIEPVRCILPLTLLERGPLLSVTGLSAISNLPDHIAERQERRAAHLLKEAGYESSIEIRSLPSYGQGTMLLVSADFASSRATYAALGSKGKPAEKVAEEAVGALLRFLCSEATVDEPAGDQIMLPLALAQGESAYRMLQITQHAVTHAAVLRKFLPVEVSIDAQVGEAGTVRLRGCGLLGGE